MPSLLKRTWTFGATRISVCVTTVDALLGLAFLGWIATMFL